MLPRSVEVKDLFCLEHTSTSVFHRILKPSWDAQCILKVFHLESDAIGQEERQKLGRQDEDLVGCENKEYGKCTNGILKTFLHVG